ncbi:MAG: sigma-70 family RNA polymerase sigma factor [Anaerolineaceae bacterium]
MDKTKINDSEISIDKLIAQDRDELARFVETYSPRIYRLGMRILNNEQDAEDVLQETFIKAIRALPTFEGRSSLSTWLYRIATNEALMLLRKHSPEMVSIDAPAEEEEEEQEALQIVDWTNQPESELSVREIRQQINSAVAKLPLGQREVFALREVEGMSVKETADILNVSESVVKTRLLRARMHLRQVLNDYFIERQKHEVADE